MASSSKLLTVFLLSLSLALSLFAVDFDSIKKELSSSNKEISIRAYDTLKTLYVNSVMSDDKEMSIESLKLLGEYAKKFGDDPKEYQEELKQLGFQELSQSEPKKTEPKSGSLRIKQITSAKESINIKYESSIDKDVVLKTFSLKDPPRIVYDIQGELLSKPPKLSLSGTKEVVIAQNRHEVVRVVLHPKEGESFNIEAKGDTLSISNATVPITPIIKQIEPSKEEPKSIEPIEPPPPPKEEIKIEATPKEESSKKIDLSNKVVVLDAGHGGKDCGALASDKTCEKDLALKITKYIRDELKSMGLKKVYLTREKDVFIKLRNRTKIANDKNADIFVSVHLNSVPKSKAAKLIGVETYFLSHARSERAKNVAAIENQDDIEDMDYFTKNTFLSILNSKRIVESNKLSIDIQRGMLKELSGYKPVDGGVREGPFWVLVGAQMPSVLIEVGYISNPRELNLLKTTAYQKKAAKGIAEGIINYLYQNG